MWVTRWTGTSYIISFWFQIQIALINQNFYWFFVLFLPTSRNKKSRPRWYFQVNRVFKESSSRKKPSSRIGHFLSLQLIFRVFFKNLLHLTSLLVSRSLALTMRMNTAFNYARVNYNDLFFVFSVIVKIQTSTNHQHRLAFNFALSPKKKLKTTFSLYTCTKLINNYV